MTKFIYGILSLFITQYLITTTALGSNLICYYNADGSEREGLAKFSTVDLEVALQFCTHLVYGYVGLNPETLQLSSLKASRDIQRRHLAVITSLKDKFPTVKFLLSVGGGQDDGGSPSKYLQLLEADPIKRQSFVESARDLVRSYNFDGLDLAFQLPQNKPRKVHSDLGSAWKSFKKFFTGDFVVDEKAVEHKKAFTELVKELRAKLQPHDLMLTLTVLPNVNSSWYYDGPALINNLNFVNLAAFDFVTPERNPEEADYSAALYAPEMKGNRQPHYNVDFQVDYWISQHIPHSKLNVGVASYGRVWKMTKDSNRDGKPLVTATDGPAPAGPQTKTPGILSWVEVCLALPNPSNVGKTGDQAPLNQVADEKRKYGTFAFRLPDAEGHHGIWTSYENPETASIKAGYAKNRNLGGIALFDLTLDDFHGQCTGDKFPMLRAIKYRLL